MKLKYYLRGLGIGIVVTVLVMMAVLGNKQPMTDAEVKARAKELGMIENTIIKDVANKNEDVVSDEKVDEETSDVETEIEDEPVEEKTDEPVSEPAEEKVDEPAEEPIEEPADENTDDSESVTITVVGGDSSWSVSKRMEEAGLIESASDFDKYLCQNGYDKRIRLGNYEITKDMSYEQMAKIITGS